MSDPQTRTVDIRGLSVRVLEDGGGPPLLFLHNAMGAGLWTPVHAALARHFRVLLPDHPGFGRCTLPEWLDGMEDVVFHYLDFLDAEGLAAPIDVVGASLGGWIAAELACRHPERVRRMVLIDAAGLRLADHPVPDVFRLPPQDVMPLLFHDVTKAMAYLPPDFSPDTLVRMFHDRTALARLAWNPYLHDPKLPRRLYRARVPCLILWGRQATSMSTCGHGPCSDRTRPSGSHRPGRRRRSSSRPRSVTRTCPFSRPSRT